MMKRVLVIGAALLVALGAGWVDTGEATPGPIELSVKDKETINIPVSAGVGAIMIGGDLLLVGGKKG